MSLVMLNHWHVIGTEASKKLNISSGWWWSRWC